MNTYNIFRVGEAIEEFRGRSEGTLLDISDDGAVMFVFFNSPTAQEIEQFQGQKRFEIRLARIKNIMMFLAKIGNLEWMDFPYSPHLSKNLTELKQLEAGVGLALTVMLVDALTGEVKAIRLLGLSERFTKVVFRAINEEKMKAWNQMEYNMNISDVYRKYSTKTLVNFARDYCKFN